MESISWFDMSNRAKNIPLCCKCNLRIYSSSHNTAVHMDHKIYYIVDLKVLSLLWPKLNAIRRSRFHERKRGGTITCSKRIHALFFYSIDRKRASARTWTNGGRKKNKRNNIHLNLHANHSKSFRIASFEWWIRFSQF